MQIMLNRTFVRLLSMALALATILAGLSFSVSAETDYTQWKQDDPRWNRLEAWPADQYPEASGRTMAENGDQVTALSVQVFSRKSESIPSHWMNDIITIQKFITAPYVRDNISSPVAYMKTIS